MHLVFQFYLDTKTQMHIFFICDEAVPKHCPKNTQSYEPLTLYNITVETARKMANDENLLTCWDMCMRECAARKTYLAQIKGTQHDWKISICAHHGEPDNLSPKLTASK